MSPLNRNFRIAISVCIFFAAGLGVTFYLLSPTHTYGTAHLLPYSEIVMSPGMKIFATNRTGPITIEHASDTKRRYTWDGASRVVSLVPRRERWYGGLGLYCPGDYGFQPNNGVSRAVVEEGQRHFKNEADALAWLDEPYNSDTLNFVYTRDGLAVGWHKVYARQQLNVDVWQILIDGKKPQNLPGARDDLVSVKRGNY